MADEMNSWGVAGAFQDSATADQAIAELQSAGFTQSDIRSATYSDETPRILGALTAMHFPEADAEYYQREFEAGHLLVIVTTGVLDRQLEANDILSRNGAHQAHTHS